MALKLYDRISQYAKGDRTDDAFAALADDLAAIGLRPRARLGRDQIEPEHADQQFPQPGTFDEVRKAQLDGLIDQNDVYALLGAFREAAEAADAVPAPIAMTVPKRS